MVLGQHSDQMHLGRTRAVVLDRQEPDVDPGDRRDDRLRPVGELDVHLDRLGDPEPRRQGVEDPAACRPRSRGAVAKLDLGKGRGRGIHHSGGAAPGDEQVERGSDGLYEHAETPQQLRAAYLTGRAAAQVPQCEARHHELDERDDDIATLAAGEYADHDFFATATA